jgi:hypothetical protein
MVMLIRGHGNWVWFVLKAESWSLYPPMKNVNRVASVWFQYASGQLIEGVNARKKRVEPPDTDTSFDPFLSTTTHKNRSILLWCK